MNFGMMELRKARVIAWITLAFFLGQPAVFAAGVVVDPNYPQARAEESANGTPVVQIDAPNSKGVSHNRYQDFNVGPNGLILNNGSNYSQTQLAGWIDKNPHLVKSGSARIILNEVRASLQKMFFDFLNFYFMDYSQ